MKRLLLSILIFIVIVLSEVFFYTQNNYLSVTNYEFSSNRIPVSFTDYKIAQISDLHNKSFGYKQSELLLKLKDEEPDIVVITGDFVDEDNRDFENAYEFIRKAILIAPIYYVNGNHELLLNDSVYDSFINELIVLGVKVLDNEAVKIINQEEYFFLIGLSDNHLYDDTLKDISKNLENNSLKVLLAHEPQYLENYQKEGVDLVLSGHAHGGQIRLPFIGGLIAPGQGIPPKYTAGIYQENQTTMILSRGLGNAVFVPRIFNYPEIVFITLKTGL